MSAQKHLLNALTAELATWLETPDFERILALISGWDDATWQSAKLVAILQGIGPFLGHTLSGSPIFPAMPIWFQEWLTDSYIRNSERIARMHADLGIILKAAYLADIPVMLLKGSLLTTKFYQKPGIRPMADLDLLIHPADRVRFGKLLVENGYRHDGWFYHDLYTNTSCEKVIMADEHPDNPRPVEVHFFLTQKFWGNFPLPDLNNMLWQNSQIGMVLGETVFIPSPEQHLAFLGWHNLKHLSKGSGRLIQWLDIAHLMDTVQTNTALPYLDMIYPVLRFAARVFPSHFKDADWQKLSQDASPRVRNWCEQTPLDKRSGLQMLPPQNAISIWYHRLQNWRPDPVRLNLAFRGTPLPQAYLRYGLAFLRHCVVFPYRKWQGHKGKHISNLP